MDDTLEGKQLFLRENILDKGYDPNEFFEFLVSKGGEEYTDLDRWSVNDLQNLVYEFISTRNGQQQQYDQYQQYNQQQQYDQQQQYNQQQYDQQYNQQQQYDQQQQYNQQQYDQQQQQQQQQQHDQQQQQQSVPQEDDTFKTCQKEETTELGSHEDLVIKIKKVEGGLFSKSYVSYLITTEPLGLQVRKRYSDFEWLHSTLAVLYPGSLIPPIARKNYNYTDRFNETFLGKRVRCMNKFFESIIQDPLIRNSQILSDFLTINDEKVFTAKKNEYNKLKQPSTISEMKSLEGKVNLTLNKKKENYLQRIMESTNTNELYMKKLISSYKSLMEELKAVSNRLVEISKIWEELFNTSTKYADNNTVSETYRLFKELHQSWSEQQKKEAHIIKIDIREYIKYLRKQFLGLKDLSHKADTQKNMYYKGKEKLRLKKEDLFKIGNTAKWELNTRDNTLDKNLLTKDKEYAFTKMLPKETQNVEHTKEMYAYYLNRVIEEYERNMRINGVNHSKTASIYCQKHLNIIMELSRSLGDIVGFLGDGNFLKEMNFDDKITLGKKERPKREWLWKIKGKKDKEEEQQNEKEKEKEKEKEEEQEQEQQTQEGQEE